MITIRAPSGVALAADWISSYLDRVPPSTDQVAAGDPTGVRPWTRIGAWLLDWLWIVLGLLAIVPFAVVLRTWEWQLSRGLWNIFTFVITVLPVTLWLAWREAAPRGASPGKRRRGLRVVDAVDGGPVPFRRTLVRNLVKVALPWELGHTMAYEFATSDFAQGIPMWLIVVSAACYTLMIWFVVTLFRKSGRTPYDRLSRTRVA